MIFGIGIDVVDNQKFAKIYERYGERFIKKIFLQEEISYCNNKKEFIECFSARFSIKEAFIKALSIKEDDGFFPVYKDIGIIGKNDAKKEIVLSSRIKRYLEGKGIKEYKVWFSISHIRYLSIGVVVIERF